MEHTLLCLLLLLSTHIYSGHSEDDDGKAKAVLTIYPTSSQIFSGESVTLRCNIQRGEVTDWEYTWRKDVVDTINRNHEYEISEVKISDNGDYWCLGKHIDQKKYSEWSDAVRLTVTALPETTLTVNPDPAYNGETVTLTCSVGSDSGWKYTWYKDNTKKVVTLSGRHTTTGATFTISRTAESDQGLYWCQGEIQSRSISSIISDPVTITVNERPVAVLTLQPNWPQIFSGETVTLSCDIQGGEEIEYAFYNSGKSVYTNTEPEYRISPAKNGLYTCEGLQKRNGLKHSQTSNALQLTVLDKPQAVLSVSPQWLNPGDSITLSCGVKESSTGWRFFWYRTVPYTAGLLSLSDRSYSVEPLSGSGSSEDSYTLIPAGPSHTGGYVCRAGRGDPVYDTLYSEPQLLWSGDPQPSLSLKTRPNRSQHFTSTSLSLSCEEKQKSTGWRLKRYREKAGESECVSNWGSRTGSTCTIRFTYTGDSGVYWCESGSGEYSNAVNITVDVGPLILESPPYPITEGESMTLSCTNRYQETNPNPKVNFYKDGVLIRNETTGEMTIPAVSKSDEGSYKCKSNEGESPESWVTVRGVTLGPSTSVLVGVVVGLVVPGVLLAILLVLLCRYKKARGSCCNRIFWPPQPQRTNLDPQQDQGSTQGRAPDAGYTRLQHGGANIFDTITPSDSNDNDADAATTGSSDVTYTQIQLKKLDKKKKKLTADRKENPVYSEVKTGKTTGPVDVTYADVDLKQKAKAKKKKETSTPPEADSVYFPLKPVTAPGP
ncbi:Fc receptor-like protein 4 isoform X2 [Salvelinus alpinus]|uniref:Fc receptor-like protein 4 isoform X2 n=1 Tax=Salvelinus alpinus TaxID=8036 RepID=UPI0039FDA7C3